jgi:hypothetical protein
VLGFVGFLAGLVGLPALLILPAWLYGRSHLGASFALPFVAVPAHAIWSLLVYLGIGAQSLANILELYVLAGLSVVLAYLQVFVVDPRSRQPKRTTLYLTGVLVAVAFILRALMPNLPE